MMQFSEKAPGVNTITHMVEVGFSYVGEAGAESDKEAADITAKNLKVGEVFTLFRKSDRTTTEWLVKGDHTAFPVH